MFLKGTITPASIQRINPSSRDIANPVFLLGFSFEIFVQVV